MVFRLTKLRILKYGKIDGSMVGEIKTSSSGIKIKEKDNIGSQEAQNKTRVIKMKGSSQVSEFNVGLLINRVLSRPKVNSDTKLLSPIFFSYFQTQAMVKDVF